MIVTDNGVPVCFRSLELFHDFGSDSVMDEIAEEIRYTLLALEAEYGRGEPCGVTVWSDSEFPPRLLELLKKQCGGSVTQHKLTSIPPLSEGLALRTAGSRPHHVELVPREWIDLQRRKRLIKVASVTSIALLGIWLATVAIAGTVFAIQKAAYNRVAKEAARYEGPANAAKAAHSEMLSLEQYSDRSRSALECLLEISADLPEGVEISSFTYKKGDAVNLRGNSTRPETVYQFFQKLGTAEIFAGIKDDLSTTPKDRDVTTFSVKVLLPKTAEEAKP
jgi:hypothetical protein